MSEDKEKQNQEELSDERSTESQEKKQIDEESLTPWQKENLHYLEGKGGEPAWKQALLKETAEEPEEVPEEPEKEEPVLKTLPKMKREKKQAENRKEKEEEEAEEEPQKSRLTDEPIETAKEKKNRKSFADRLPHLKDQRNKVLHRRLIVLLTAFSIPLVFFVYHVSPFSKLQHITVSGNEMVLSEEVLESSRLEKGVSIWAQFFDRKTYEKSIKEQIQQVKSADISFSGITSFKISVKEFKETALLQRDGKYYPILENGIVLEKESSTSESDYPIFQDFKDKKIIEGTIKAYDGLAPEIAGLISEIRYTPSKSNAELLTLTMSDGNQVLVPYSTMDSQMKYYSQVAGQMEQNGMIDMEVGIFSYPFDTGEENEEGTEGETENPAENEAESEMENIQ